jgi:hypothetical protein
MIYSSLNIRENLKEAYSDVYTKEELCVHQQFVPIFGKQFLAKIPAAYTDTQYPLQYYFELKEGPKSAWMYPGFNKELTNQPYFVVRKR